MGLIMLTASQLEAKKEKLNKENKELKNTIEELQQLIASLHNDWEGDASDAFMAEGKKVTNNMKDGTNGINDYIQALDKIIHQYRDTEKKNVQIAKR